MYTFARILTSQTPCLARNTSRFFSSKPAAVSYANSIAKTVRGMRDFYQVNDSCWCSATRLLTLAKGNPQEIKTFDTIKPTGPILMGPPWLEHIKKLGFQSLEEPSNPTDLSNYLKNFGPLVLVTDPGHQTGLLHVVNIVGIENENAMVLDNKNKYLLTSQNGYSYSLSFSELTNLTPRDEFLSCDAYYDIPKGLRPPIFDPETGKLIKSADLPRTGSITIRQAPPAFYYLPGLLNKLEANNVNAGVGEQFCNEWNKFLR